MEEGAKLPDYLADLFNSERFIEAVDAVGTDEPHWEHSCKGCTFLGCYELPSPDPHHPHATTFDLYVHRDEAVSARYGPRQDEYVIASIQDAETHRFEAPTHPVIEALRRWKEKFGNG